MWLFIKRGCCGNKEKPFYPKDGRGIRGSFDPDSDVRGAVAEHGIKPVSSISQNGADKISYKTSSFMFGFRQRQESGFIASFFPL